MKPILLASEMAKTDNLTIEKHNLPSLILMERAALSICEEIKSRFVNTNTISVICGSGNNGADGVALARMLHLNNYKVNYIIIGNSNKYSKQLVEQLKTAKSYGIKPCDTLDKLPKADIIVDALFGIGLSRDVTGDYEEAISYINSSVSYIIACDIPSGICSDNGKMLGTAVKANLTMTMAYLKKGLLLGDAPNYCGEIKVCDVGIYLEEADAQISSKLITDEDLNQIPKRPKTANKGTCGKVLVIAGSSDIYGACYFSAKAASRAGSGLVSIYTHPNNRTTIQDKLPEAMCNCYETFDQDELDKLMQWADAIILGPGISTSELAEKIVCYVVSNSKVPIVIDADGINNISKNLSILDNTTAQVILTPHLKEMSRLTKLDVTTINYDMESTATTFAKAHNCTVVLKNHTSIVASPNKNTYYINSGNEALATAGSGDVLAGIIGSLLGQGLDVEKAASLGAFWHGKAGSLASLKTGINGLLASDIIDFI